MEESPVCLGLRYTAQVMHPVVGRMKNQNGEKAIGLRLQASNAPDEWNVPLNVFNVTSD